MGSFGEAPPGNSKASEKIFKTKCAQCHTVDKGAGQKQAGYSYSAANKNKMQSLYRKGEFVLATYGERIYKAKWRCETTHRYILSITINGMSGWVPTLVETNGSQAIPLVSAKGKKRIVVAKGKKRIVVAKGKKQQGGSGIEETRAPEELIKIQIPTNLMMRLVDDWEQITQQNKLFQPPRSPTVDEIFSTFVEIKSKKDGL
ncbi:Cytochrome c proximal, isoform B [Castilleja foliolosa]|uniref:Cytochrome c proximal, isoform B n=1 Tax=Castilleja foliolosa TaxID=1961234 RepID=A0ABD3BB25_9LAMI